MGDDDSISDLMASGLFYRDSFFKEIERAGRADGARFSHVAKPALERKPRKPPTPDGLLLPPQAASKLNVTVEQLFAFVHGGELRAINMGRGSKRPRYAFTDDDLNELIEKRQIREASCPSTSPKNPRRISGTTSKSLVVGFTALRNAQIAKTPKSSKR